MINFRYCAKIHKSAREKVAVLRRSFKIAVTRKGKGEREKSRTVNVIYLTWILKQISPFHVLITRKSSQVLV